MWGLPGLVWGMWVCPIGQNRYHGCEGCSPIPFGIGTQHSGRTVGIAKRKRRVAGERIATFLGGLLGKELSLFDLGRVAGERAATCLCWRSGYGASLGTFRRLITRGLTSRPVYLMLCIVMVIN